MSEIGTITVNPNIDQHRVIDKPVKDTAFRARFLVQVVRADLAFWMWNRAPSRQ